MLACIYIHLIRWSFVEALGYNCTTDIEVHSFTVLHLSRRNFPADDSVQIPSTIHPILGLVIISEVRSKLGRGSLAWHQNHGDRGLYFTITLMIEFMNNRNAVVN